MSDLIEREQLRRALYEEAMVKDSEDQRWDGGCWIRYRMAERLIEEAPSAQPKLAINLPPNCHQIATDCISRQAAIDELIAMREHIDARMSVIGCTAYDMAIEALREPEIIRCKDCKHWDGKKNGGFCEVWDKYISNDAFFCGSAERREEDD